MTKLTYLTGDSSALIPTWSRRISLITHHPRCLGPFYAPLDKAGSPNSNSYNSYHLSRKDFGRLAISSRPHRQCALASLLPTHFGLSSSRRFRPLLRFLHLAEHSPDWIRIRDASPQAVAVCEYLDYLGEKFASISFRHDPTASMGGKAQ